MSRKKVDLSDLSNPVSYGKYIYDYHPDLISHVARAVYDSSSVVTAGQFVAGAAVGVASANPVLTATAVLYGAKQIYDWLA